MKPGEENLIPQSERTKEEQREIAIQGGKASGVARRKKKLMSQIYADFLINKHKIKLKDGEELELEGHELVRRVMNEMISKGDSTAARMIKEIREGTEGNKVKMEGGLEVVYIDRIKQDI